jgi:hypothetical protein
MNTALFSLCWVLGCGMRDGMEVVQWEGTAWGGFHMYVCFVWSMAICICNHLGM